MLNLHFEGLSTEPVVTLIQSESRYQWTFCTVFSGVKWKTWLNDDINQGLSAGVSSQNEAPWMEVLDPGPRARCILARCPDISRYGRWYISYFLKQFLCIKLMMNIQAQTWPRQSRVIYWIIGIYDQEIFREKLFCYKLIKFPSGFLFQWINAYSGVY